MYECLHHVLDPCGDFGQYYLKSAVQSVKSSVGKHCEKYEYLQVKTVFEKRKGPIWQSIASGPIVVFFEIYISDYYYKWIMTCINTI